MDVRIDEVQSTIDAVDGNALLTPQTLDRIVGAVLRALEAEQRSRETLRGDLDTQSIVDQQRGGER